MIDAALLAFAIGVKGATAGRAFVFVRDAGPPVPFEVTMRHRDNTNDDWVEVKDLKFFPPRPSTSKRGRKVTLVLPDNLQQLVQVCAVTPPSYQTRLKRQSLDDLKPEDTATSSGSSVRLDLRVQSCINLPLRKTRQV